MSKVLSHIRNKIQNIQFGILRFREDENNQSWTVKATADKENVLHCLVESEGSTENILNRNVNLVQKHHNDYLYISGKVSATANERANILSIHIHRACWFVRKSKGDISWLQEKYIYDDRVGEELDLAS